MWCVVWLWIVHWRIYGRKRSWPTVRDYPVICLTVLSRTTNNLIQGSLSRRKWEPVTFRMVFTRLTAQSTCSAWCWLMTKFGGGQMKRSWCVLGSKYLFGGAEENHENLGDNWHLRRDSKSELNVSGFWCSSIVCAVTSFGYEAFKAECDAESFLKSWSSGQEIPLLLKNRKLVDVFTKVVRWFTPVHPLQLCKVRSNIKPPITPAHVICPLP
jgi:hypothetical protein